MSLEVGVVASMWVPLLGLGSFATLLLSGVLFFGGYLAMLLILKETLAKELFHQVFKKK